MSGRAGRMGDHLVVPLSGHRIQRFPPDRICMDCATVLSIYNETEFCSVHERPRKLTVNRVL
jgi:hypothetical protein